VGLFLLVLFLLYFSGSLVSFGFLDGDRNRPCPFLVIVFLILIIVIFDNAVADPNDSSILGQQKQAQ
jgi:hypothetical protein